MSYQVLARKWRPKYFREVKGQAHITQTLINSIKNNKIAHAYLLTGTRGIGKTTIARIFAKAIRCENLSTDGEPCLKCDSCLSIDSGNSLDYLEVDGASNNSVDNIRDLIENVQYLPSSGKYKVYVVDEVHMLTTSAFNALLKTLEEPPEHVVFIFATTDPQKLLGTVLSRCQRFDFKNSTVEETKNLLLEIAKSENISFENESLVLELARQGKGSFRDSLSLFDQVISLSESNQINEDTLMLSLGMAKVKSISNMVSAILAQNKEAVLQTFQEVLAENIDLKRFAKQILDKIYNLLVNLDEQGNLQETDLDSTILESVSLVEIMWVYENLSKDLDWALSSFDPEKACGFSFVKMALRETIVSKNQDKISVKKKLNSSTSDETVVSIEPEQTVEPVSVSPPVQEEVPAPVEEPKQVVEEVPVASVQEEKTWENFIKYLYSTKGSLALNLERGNVLNVDSFNNQNANFKVGFSDECKIFYDYLSEPANKKELVKACAAYFDKEEETINLSLEIIDNEMIESSNFRSSVELVEDADKKDTEEQTNLILNNKYIKEAESIFSSKIEKVVLNKDK